jgi:hypothetical protein
MSQWSRARVNIDYHIAFDANFYSVPYTLVHELIEVRATPTTIEIFHKGERVASHLRGRGRGQVCTEKEHRPKSHQAHLEWTLRAWWTPPGRILLMDPNLISKVMREMGRKGDKKGGKKGAKMRAEALTPEQRSQIARKAAKSRWAKAKKKTKKAQKFGR